jgi:integrase/recombinase XerD
MNAHRHIPEFITHLQDNGLAWSTIRLYGQILFRFKSWADTDINTLKEEDIKRYLRGIRGTGVHLKEVAGVLKRYYDWLDPADNPMKNIKRKNPPKRDILPITFEEFLRIRAVAPVRIRNLIIFMAITGTRISEALFARRRDFVLDRIENGQRRPVMMVTGKGGKVRIVPLTSPGLVRWIERRLAQVEPVTVKTRGVEIEVDGPFAGITYEMAYYGIHKAADTAGVQRITWEENGKRGYHVSPHGFRRLAATSMIDREIPIDVVQAVLGHADINTTRLYAKTSEARMWSHLAASGDRAREAYVH